MGTDPPEQTELAWAVVITLLAATIASSISS